MSCELSSTPPYTNPLLEGVGSCKKSFYVSVTHSRECAFLGLHTSRLHGRLGRAAHTSCHRALVSSSPYTFPTDPFRRGGCISRWLHLGCYLVGSVWFTVGSGVLLYDSLYSPLLILSDDQVSPPSLSARRLVLRPSSRSLARLRRSRRYRCHTHTYPAKAPSVATSAESTLTLP